MPFGETIVAVVGAGVMGEALVKGLLHQKLLDPGQIVASDPYDERCRDLAARHGIRTTTSNVEAVEGADIVVLSVKPQVMGRVLRELRGRVDRVSLVLSIAAGVPISVIARELLNARVVRAMPNTPGQIGQGITVWAASPDVMEQQRTQSEALLGALGDQIYVEDESFLDMATALSGSGPAYVFLFMEALIDAGVHMGFSRRVAERLVMKTLLGSVLYAMESGEHQAELRNQVTSPGGTSAAGLYELEKGGLRTVISRAVWRAYQRSVELGSNNKVEKKENL